MPDRVQTLCCSTSSTAVIPGHIGRPPAAHVVDLRDRRAGGGFGLSTSVPDV
jgi:hypothetical protein